MMNTRPDETPASRTPTFWRAADAAVPNACTVLNREGVEHGKKGHGTTSWRSVSEDASVRGRKDWRPPAIGIRRRMIHIQVVENDVLNCLCCWKDTLSFW